jgi:cytochrome c oxidase subunit 4
MSTDPAEINRHVRVYLMIFAALLVLTGLTVAAWKWGPEAVGPTIAVALLIAIVKASLVALFFMHLSAEKKLIYWVLAITVVFFFVLLFVPILTANNVISL